VNSLLRFAAPRQVTVVDVPAEPLQPGYARIKTLYSGISAGTEMTAYRGTNPYITSAWDPDIRLFRGVDAQPDGGYPLDGWGYSEVGEVVEIAPSDGSADTADQPIVGDIVWGIWGHRSEGVLPLSALRGHVLPVGLNPLAAAFVRVGAIALNGVLAADLGVGTTVVIFGQGVIGLLATRFAVLNGATVIAVDGVESRLTQASAWGAHHTLKPGPDLAYQVRDLTNGQGADVAIELSGNYHALHEAMRVVGADGTVIASGFYQGDATPLRLGEEFHHNRVQIIASQIGSAPSRLRGRWDVPRLQRTVIDALADGRLDAAALVTHRYSLTNAAAAYELLDTNPAEALQIMLEF
jgi:2-desacetyl-2-hydroxyethyl bacteriochlorophyllide A dehydrogenase